MKKAMLISDIEWLLSYLDIQSIKSIKSLIEKILDEEKYEVSINHESIGGEYAR
jgi:hypothetical protein